MSANGLNVELAERVVLQALIHPEQHDQNSWYLEDVRCGTIACLAGWTVLLGGTEQQLNHCINIEYDWDSNALHLLGVEACTLSDVRDNFANVFSTYDNYRAIEMFCTFFGLDLGALQEKANAARGELGA